ncbi:MAG: hypothetical protein NTW19_19905 [Planctomycetota bacterium]|nr:hypothetical protein [Planctomycetota bacterium]
MNRDIPSDDIPSNHRPENDAGADGNLAVAARLACLGTMPVDATGLERRLREVIPQPAEERRPRRWELIGASLAAGIAIALGVTFVLLRASVEPAVASAAAMTETHEALVAGRVPVMEVDSIEAAGRALALREGGVPSLPSAPQGHVMACCMRSVANKDVACVLLKAEGKLVTLAVARDTDLAAAPGTSSVTVEGQSFAITSANRVTMATTRRDGRLICLMGDLPGESLARLGAALRFEKP